MINCWFWKHNWTEWKPVDKPTRHHISRLVRHCTKCRKLEVMYDAEDKT